MPTGTLNLAPVIAHRGASGYAPENTLAAMQKAHALGAKWVEFDVMLTGDGQAVVLHDLTLSRTTNGRGRVANRAYSQIAQLDAGSWFAPEFCDERVPTLTALLPYLAKLGLQINVEIKPKPGQELTTTQKTLEILARDWPCSQSPPLVSSSSLHCLREARRLQNTSFLGVIADCWPAAWRAVTEELGCISWHLNERALNPKRVAQLRQAGQWVLAYTVNQAERALELFAWGVKAVFTDYPDVILQARRQHGWDD